MTSGNRGLKSRIRRVDSSPDAPSATALSTAPSGDVRLTVNLQADLHAKLKIRAAQERSTMGDLIEAWIRSW